MTDAVNAVTSSLTTSSATPTTSLDNKTVDYDAFLQLLVAQLENQDPTEPTDNAELMAQLASFSSVEQQVQTNNKLDQLLVSNALGDATNLIGKAITTASGIELGTVSAVVLTDEGINAETEDGNTYSLSSGIRITEQTTSDEAA